MVLDSEASATAGAVAASPAPDSSEFRQFDFGSNWQDFLKRHLTAERVEIARQSLAAFLGIESLQGKSFLDIGCGSGLYSLAAHQLGAARITSLDVNPRSVWCTRQLWESAGNPAHWDITLGSIMNEELVAATQPHDVVYAWGSLPFTGDMWGGVRNAARLVAEGGLFYIAIYNRKDGPRGSQLWRKIKHRYNYASAPVKKMMEYSFIALNAFVLPLTRLQSPWAYARAYRGGARGMNLYTDLRDWLGGYPYEFASAEEVLRFCRSECGLELLDMKLTHTLDNNEFLFRRPRAPRA